MELQLHSIKLESYNAWTSNRYQQLSIEWNGTEQLTEWCKEKSEEGKRCFNWSGAQIKFDIDNNDTEVVRILIYGKGLLVQKVILGEEILNIRDKIPSHDGNSNSEIVFFSIGIKNQSRKANIIIAKLFFRGIVTFKKEKKIESFLDIDQKDDNIDTIIGINDEQQIEEISQIQPTVIEEINQIQTVIDSIEKIVETVNINVNDQVIVDSSSQLHQSPIANLEERCEKYNSLFGLISIEAIEHKMLMDGICQSDVNAFLSLQKISQDNTLNFGSKAKSHPPPPPPPPPQHFPTNSPIPNQPPPPSKSSIKSQPPPPPKSTPVSDSRIDTSYGLGSSKSVLFTEDGEILTNKTPFVITKRKEKLKDYTNVKGFRENIESILYSAEAQCAQLEAVLSFNEVSISEIMIKIESFCKDIRTLTDRDITNDIDKFRLKDLVDRIELTLSSNPPLNANAKYQHLDKMRLLNQRSKDANIKLNQILTYLSQPSLSQLFIDSLDKEIEMNNIGHFSSLAMIKSKLEILYRNLSALTLKLTNLLRPNMSLLKVLENRIIDEDSSFLTYNFILNYVDPNDGMNIGSLLVRSRSIGLLKSVYSWPSLMVLFQSNNKYNMNSSEMKSQRRKSWVQISNNYTLQKVEYIESIKVHIDDIDFFNPSDLRCKGFTLEQLRLSGCFTDKEIMNAGFAMKELKINGNLSVADFRAAGLDINACREAGFTPIQLRQGGFDEVTVVRYGGFTIKQLKSSGCDIQRHALMGFFDSLDGHHWKNKENWGTNKPLNEWHGIVLNGAGEVIKIDLRCNGLRGKIPESLIYLTSLEYLDLYHNNICAPIPEAIKSLKKLKNLWLNENTLKISSMEKSVLATHLNKCTIRV